MKHRIGRLLIGFSLLLSMSIPAASGRVVDIGAGACPTRFDYVMLASFADSSHWLSLSSYRFQRKTNAAASTAAGVRRVAYGAHRTGGNCPMHPEQVSQHRA